MGKVHQAKGSLTTALKLYHKAIEKDEENHEYLESFAILSFKMENPQTAVSYFLKAIEAAPHIIGLWLKLAKCYYELDYFSETYDVIHQATELFETETSLLYIEGLCLYKLGKIQSSNELFVLALTTDFEEHKVLFDWDEGVQNIASIVQLIDQYKHMTNE